MPTMKFQNLKIASVMMGMGVVLFGVQGCGSTAQEMRLALKGTNRLNLTESGQPAPTSVRIYTLRESQRFQKATYKDLKDKDTAELGDDLIHRDELTVQPEESQQFEVMVDREKEEKFIGIMVLFRQYPKGVWRLTIPVEEKGIFSIGAQKFTFELTDHTIRQIEPD